ncbi:class I SAM-dependent methyltransferase [Subsaximicrobium wynnwilliamsii]|uniref:Class I SAM-dependent methyltransferase n=1 Tax=Subsaximicrobium wynnwilliamsii TaxID=291179 RepID=A0A5C6ZEU6_9FLAO|nr:class I SAM-dependent methyltransferase [Subsaximicrobium wynnwilliamsii]TXD82835.1 class I SAM-dependent methyltransferase [Subsaximicrobium wynnwilliamsii]TXD88557.1 class I SAM-dependent methyltransferase [Subsaximicrobium wynnwilliamsii]TXE02446.1 class I SAM-dependent methyltransferase [Subsaximicrobium wynnwilliamsii]
MYENTYPNKRFKHTMDFLQHYVSTEDSILDLGVTNPLSELMQAKGFEVQNTSGLDLDLDTSEIESTKANVVTAFEIFEHLLSPFTVLRSIKADKLVASIPLNLWFASAYRSKIDMRDRHFHEFEDWQFDWLLEKAGWKIIASEKWTNPTKQLGIRPILRRFTPRYYIVYAERVKNPKA